MQFHGKECKDTMGRLKLGQGGNQYDLGIFLSGTGDVRKSHQTELVDYATMMRLLKPLSGYFKSDDVIVVLTAFTGSAAFGIKDMTVYSALKPQNTDRNCLSK